MEKKTKRRINSILRRMEKKNGDEKWGGEKKGREKTGRSSKAELLGRERSWSVESGKSIDEFFKRKRDKEEIELEEEEGDRCRKKNCAVKSPEKNEGMEMLLRSLIEEVRKIRRQQRKQREENRRERGEIREEIKRQSKVVEKIKKGEKRGQS